VSGGVAPAAFVDALTESGIGLVSSVPCSYFGGVFPLLDGGRWPELRHVPAVNEGSALAVAAGSWLGGVPAAVLAQNSGFGNLVNPLTSLLLPYRIPALVLLSMRGWPAAEAGEPQHELMGRVVPDWLRSVDVPYTMLTPDGPPLARVVELAGEAWADRRPAFVLVAKGAIAGAAGASEPARTDAPTRADVVAALRAETAGELVLSTTGYLSRELFNAGDDACNFYMQGSMGHVGSIALGAALAQPDRRFVVLDGDGALLMHLGSAATVAHLAAPNLFHVVFDNGGYESTGAQPTAAGAADLAAVGCGLGYRFVAEVSRPEELRPALRTLLAGTGPSLLVVRGANSPAPSGRASESVTAPEIAARFAAAAAGSA
jgi:phosphonopyruvate decarboxylase